MKKMKYGLFVMLFVLSVFALTACSRDSGSGNKTGTTQSTGQTTSRASDESGSNQSDSNQSGSAQSGTSQSSSGSMESTEDMEDTESTGVIDGLVDDVEKGVDDIVGDTNGASGGTGESR